MGNINIEELNSIKNNEINEANCYKKVILEEVEKANNVQNEYDTPKLNEVMKKLKIIMEEYMHNEKSNKKYFNKKIIKDAILGPLLIANTVIMAVITLTTNMLPLAIVLTALGCISFTLGTAFSMDLVESITTLNKNKKNPNFSKIVSDIIEEVLTKKLELEKSSTHQEEVKEISKEKEYLTSKREVLEKYNYIRKLNTDGKYNLLLSELKQLISFLNNDRCYSESFKIEDNLQVYENMEQVLISEKFYTRVRTNKNEKTK